VKFNAGAHLIIDLWGELNRNRSHENLPKEFSLLLNFIYFPCLKVS
jgi:hypothetical protein